MKEFVDIFNQLCDGNYELEGEDPFKIADQLKDELDGLASDREWLGKNYDWVVHERDLILSLIVTMRCTAVIEVLKHSFAANENDEALAELIKLEEEQLAKQGEDNTNP